MFNQILVKPEDHDSLRFVWRYNKTEQPQDYVMNVHLFGKADSPSKSTETLPICN